MRKEINLLSSLPKPKRNLESRTQKKTKDIIAKSREYDFLYFDGPREYGYGGYKYDGRWKSVARDFKSHYSLNEKSRVLDIGCATANVLSYLDEAKENRTGVSKASAGLNAEALQSTTKAAVAATMSGAQGRVELICRHFAEGGMKELFSLVNNLVVKHQEGQDMFRLNNQFIPVDPRYWNSDKDITVNVAISKNSDDEKIAMLSNLAGKQEQILQQLGPNNPLVNLQQYSNTLTKMIELAGFKDAQSFINTQVPPIPPQPDENKPDPAELLAQAEIQKAQVQAQKAIIDAETDRMKIIMDDDRQRDEAEADIRLKAAELAGKYGTQIDIAEINALMERDRETIRQIAKTQSQGLFNDDFDLTN